MTFTKALMVGGAVLVAVMPAAAQAPASTQQAKITKVATGPKTPKKKKEDLKALAKISKDSARTVALAQVPAGSKVRHSTLERENGNVVYSFDIKVPKQSGVEEVMVNAVDGAVVSQKHETPQQEKAEAKAAKKKG